jgi:hypothetical protein
MQYFCIAVIINRKKIRLANPEIPITRILGNNVVAVVKKIQAFLFRACYFKRVV